MARVRLALLTLAILTAALPVAADLIWVEDQSPWGYEGIGDAKLSPDGRFLYVTDYTLDHINVYWRDLETAELEEATEHAGVVDGPISMAFSPDGLYLYMLGYYDRRIAIFQRSILSGDLFLVATTDPHPDMGRPQQLALSPDGSHLYVPGGGGSEALVVYARDDLTGLLTEVEVHRDGESGVIGMIGPNPVAVSPDGEHVYVACYTGNTLLVFDRDPTTGTLTFVEVHEHTGAWNLSNPLHLVVSPDGENVYVAVSGIATYTRDPQTGELARVQTELSLGRVKGIKVTQDSTRVYGCGIGGNPFKNRLGGFVRLGVNGLLFPSEEIRGGDQGPSPASCFGMEMDPSGTHFFVNNTRFVQGPDGNVTNYKYDVGAFRRSTVSCKLLARTDCRQTTRPGASSLKLSRRADKPESTRLKWSWKGEETLAAELFDPVQHPDDYAVCVYDDAGRLLHALAPGASDCKGRDCWLEAGSGLRFKDGTGRLGIRSLVFKPGDTGRARFTVSGKGEALNLVPGPRTGQVQAQLLASDGHVTRCWESHFSAPQKNTGEVYRARSD